MATCNNLRSWVNLKFLGWSRHVSVVDVTFVKYLPSVWCKTLSFVAADSGSVNNNVTWRIRSRCGTHCFVSCNGDDAYFVSNFVCVAPFWFDILSILSSVATCCSTWTTMLALNHASCHCLRIAEKSRFVNLRRILFYVWAICAAPELLGFAQCNSQLA